MFRLSIPIFLLKGSKKYIHSIRQPIILIPFFSFYCAADDTDVVWFLSTYSIENNIVICFQKLNEFKNNFTFRKLYNNYSFKGRRNSRKTYCQCTTYQRSSFTLNPVEITKRYEGEVYKNGFKIKRYIDYRNSFIPEISGSFSTIATNTEINISMRLFTIVKLFAIVWLGLVGLVCVGILLSHFFVADNLPKIQFVPITLIPFGMFIFGCLLFTIPFKIESYKAKNFLSKLFEAQ